MGINIISVKQLRENFNKVKEGVKKGQRFLLIYRSQPLAEIKPVTKKRKSRSKKEESIESKLEKVRKLAGGFNFGKGLTPKQINQLIDNQYDEEVKKMLFRQ